MRVAYPRRRIRTAEGYGATELPLIAPPPSFASQSNVTRKSTPLPDPGDHVQSEDESNNSIEVKPDDTSPGGPEVDSDEDSDLEGPAPYVTTRESRRSHLPAD